MSDYALGVIAKYKLKKTFKEKFCLICFLYCVDLFQWFIWFKQDIKKNSGCKSKRIKQKTTSYPRYSILQVLQQMFSWLLNPI